MADPQGGAGGRGAAPPLAALGLLVLVLRLAAVYTWLDLSVPDPAVLLAGIAARAAALLLLTAAMAVVGGRDLATRYR
ncbi:hypothetical protein ACFWBB_00470 [Streptomyces sp. NPDC060000]|uniref:hypothetical protein n=1 Tax=Streptomyces sp. NPDC060000 TaxID=3347031 RepID=UPI0036AFF29A